MLNLLRRSKFTWLAMAFMLLCAALADGAGQVYAQNVSPIKVYVDTKRIPFDVDPLLENGTTLVQIRPLFEAMDIALGWDPEKRIVTGKKDALAFTLTVDSKEAVINGKKQTLEKAARIVDGNTLVPLRFVGEATGAIVAWDSKNREITLFTEQLLDKLGLSKEEAEKIIAGIVDSANSGQTATTDPATSGEKQNDGKDEEEKAPAVPVDLARLQGMYYGLRSDFGGYECGGACWDYYTFLPNHKVVVGGPESGGPETIDCGMQTCSSYTIKDGQLKLDNGKSYSIQLSPKRNLVIEDVLLSPVPPVTGKLQLEGEYVYRGYTGLVGINVSSSSWEEWITFKKDGTFESRDLQLGTLDTQASTTNSAASSSNSGTYKIDGNTITLKFKDGKAYTYVFFIHPGKDGKPNLADIQIGDRNFYVDTD